MKSRITRIWLVIFLIGFGVSGCGPAKPAAEVSVQITPTHEPPPIEVATTVEPSAPGMTATDRLVATAADGTAEAAFQKALVAFQEGRLDTVYEFLPASYQSDVENIVHDFAEKMDAELWAKTFEFLKRISRILQSKKSLFLNLDNIKKAPQYDSIRTHWDSVTSGLEDVVTSEVSNINNLKKCDVKRLLGMASQLLVDKGLPLPKFGDVTVSTVDSGANTATLSYREAKDREPKQVEFVKIEGKWLPKTIANGWSGIIASTKLQLAELPGHVSAIKPLVIQQLDGINGMLDQIEQAKTAEQFNSAMMPVFLSIALGKGWVEQSLRDAEIKPRKANAVQIFVNRELSERDQTKLKDAVLSAIDDPNVEYEIIPNDGKTRLRFTPVSNIETVVEVIQREFDGAKIVQDSEARVIRIELK